jgi:hypothetical protein
MSRAMKGDGGKMERADDAKEVVPLSLQKLRDLAESLKASMPVFRKREGERDRDRQRQRDRETETDRFAPPFSTHPACV